VIITQSLAAELMGLTARRLRQMCSERDPPPKNAEGQFDARQFGLWMMRRAAESVAPAADGTSYDYELERARLTKEQADKTALENDLLRGEVVRAALIEQHWSDLCANFRARLVSLPSRLGALVPDVAQRQKFIAAADAHVYGALAEVEQDALTDEMRTRRNRSLARDSRAESEAAAEADVE